MVMPSTETGCASGESGPLATPRLSKARYDICVTKKLKPNEAGVVWFGYENTFLETLLAGEETGNRLDNQNNGTAIGRAEVVVAGENYGLKVIDLDGLNLDMMTS